MLKQYSHLLVISSIFEHPGKIIACGTHLPSIRIYSSLHFKHLTKSSEYISQFVKLVKSVSIVLVDCASVDMS